MKSFSRVISVIVLLVLPVIGWAQEQPQLAQLLVIQPDLTAEQTVHSLRGVVNQAIATNPEVQASWQAYQAVGHEQDAARGDYLPSLDLNARAGYEGYRSNGSNSDYQPGELSVALTQMIYDGFATRNDVSRLGAEKRVRFYELLEVAENTALAVVTSYLDVLRYRNLLAYAEENLQRHQEIYSQVEERVQAGIGRGVDLDQATGRLALARANRMTEENNLHDVSARFLRLVGTLPQASLQPPTQLATKPLPNQTKEALHQAFYRNPAINAAFERVVAAQKARQVRKSPFQPRVELRAHHDIGAERDRIKGNSSESVVELVASFNLYRGGTDSAIVKQYCRLIKQAVDLREKVCRDVRQTLTIAMNSIDHLTVQLTYLKAHQQSSAKAREAYRNQFDIGQRTLLDLLDTENEYFQARRAYTIASYDFVLARAQSAAGMGQLLTVLGVRDENAASADPVSCVRDEDSVTRFCAAQDVPSQFHRKGTISDQPWLK